MELSRFYHRTAQILPIRGVRNKGFSPGLSYQECRIHADPRTPESVTLLLPSEKSRQLAQLQVKASYKQAKEFRELAQKVKAG